MEKNNKFFINPYNFVPVKSSIKVSEVCSKSSEEDIRLNELLTGYLECHLYCKTPIVIPDTANKELINSEKEHYKYPFLGVKFNEPRIPGSSIRGVIRNVYETLTDSCFVTMKDETLISARGKLEKPGLLKNDGENWKLCPAVAHLIVIDERFHSNQALEKAGIQLYSYDELKKWSGKKRQFVLSEETDLSNEQKKYLTGYNNKKDNTESQLCKYVKKIVENNANAEIPEENIQEGYACTGEKIEKRHFCYIFQCLDNESEINVTDVDLERLDYIQKLYSDSKVNRFYPQKHTGYIDYREMKTNGVIPVYYYQDSGRLYMSFASLGRKAYSKTLNDNGALQRKQRCKKRDNLCPACSLFGNIGDEAIGSRIRFTDAICSNYNEKNLKKDVTFQELSSPRISYLPFYMRECNVKYKVEEYKKGYDSDVLEIRGRKFYWHHEPKCMRVYPSKLNATYDVLEKGEFVFKVYFDGITEEQLALLIVSLNLYDNKMDSDYCHKIGHGKPLGYGSVKIVTSKCFKRTFGNGIWKMDPLNEINYGNLKITAQSKLGELLQVRKCDKDIQKALLKICNMKALSKVDANCEYPEILSSDDVRGRLRNNDLAKHKWFTENYSYTYDENRMRKMKVLPEILDTELRLPKYECFLNNNKPNYRFAAEEYSRLILNVGDVIEGTVTGIHRIHGVFVDIGNGRPGLVHKNKISTEQWEYLSTSLGNGDKVNVKIIKIKKDGKTVLSLEDLLM